MAEKMRFCFTNIWAKIFLHLLSYSFCTEHHSLIQFLLNQFSLKVSKLICFGANNCGEIEDGQDVMTIKKT